MASDIEPEMLGDQLLKLQLEKQDLRKSRWNY